MILGWPLYALKKIEQSMTPLKTLRCPRCGLIHLNIEAKKFVEKGVLTNFTYWATCPKTREPILIDPGIEQRALDEICKEEDRKVFSMLKKRGKKYA